VHGVSSLSHSIYSTLTTVEASQYQNDTGKSVRRDFKNRICLDPFAPQNWLISNRFARSPGTDRSLLRCARRGGSLPTLSRHITALELDLGVTLFDRRGDGLALTQTGVRLFEHAEDVSKAAARFAVAASGHDDQIAGNVRITASRAVANFMLPDILAKLGTAQPDIVIEVVATDASSNLLMREADIAVRMFRPTQANLIAKKIGELQLAPFATSEYLAARGTPQTIEDLHGHDIIGEDSDDRTGAELRAMGLPVGPDFFRYKCDDPTVAWNMVLAGCGIGIGPLRLGNGDPRVQRGLPDMPNLTLPIWLTSHAELRTSARVRIVFDFLADALLETLASG
jgi:DNA-binding transcriptional LysR family regulator